MSKLALIACAFACCVVMGARGVAAQENPAVRVRATAEGVAGGDRFQVEVVQDAAFVSIGIQTDVVFDPALVRVVDVRAGGAYADASLLVGEAPQTKEQAIARANATGRLKGLATFFTPGSGSVPEGAAVAFIVTMQAVPGDGGRATIAADDELASGSLMLDAGGVETAYTSMPATVTISAGSGGEPLPTAEPATPTPSVPENPLTPEATEASQGDPPPAATFRVSPASVTVDKGATFSIEVKVETEAAISASDVNIAFDHGLIQIERVQVGERWRSGFRTEEDALADAMREANRSGTLSPMTFAFDADAAPSTGESVMVTLTMRAADRDGETEIALLGAGAQTANARQIPVTVEHGEVIVGEGASSTNNMLFILGGVGGLLIAGAAGVGLLRTRGA